MWSVLDKKILHSGQLLALRGLGALRGDVVDDTDDVGAQVVVGNVVEVDARAERLGRCWVFQAEEDAGNLGNFVDGGGLLAVEEEHLEALLDNDFLDVGEELGA